MMLKVSFLSSIIAGTLLMVSGCNSDNKNKSNDVENDTPVVTEIPTAHPNGSGYTDLEGMVINYEYVDFSAFRITFFDNKTRWEGYKRGYFLGATQTLSPQVSKVAEDIYFASWPITPVSGDNVVFNFNGMNVRAHLGGGSDRFTPIHGQVYCLNGGECIAPTDQEGMTLPEVGEIIGQNTFSQELSPMAPSPVGTLNMAEEAAMLQLDGKTIEYNTPEGTIQVRVNGLQIVANENGVETEHISHVSLIANGVYLISWGDGVDGPGNHIVFNSGSMKVFDHIMPDQTRVEAIYEAKCFGNSESCPSI